MNGNNIEPAADLSWRDVDGGFVVLNTYSGEYFVFNGVGRLAWLAIAEGKSSEEIVKSIALDYEVENEESVHQDIQEFIEEAINNKLLVRH